MNYQAQSDIWRLEQITKARPIMNQNGKSRVLGRFHQVFPLAIFPDELTIEELRIVHFKRNGPWTNEVISIMATDIACVSASCGPFFGHIHIQSLTGGPNITIMHLFRNDVLRIRSLVEGIALTLREGLKIDQGELATKRAELLRAGSF